MSKMILVFGSNEAGIHGAGAAKTAYEKHGARWGFSYGHCGDSWAIPTKDQDILTLPLDRIEGYVKGFLSYAEGHPKLTFKVTRIGCGLAGLDDQRMAAFFYNAPKNCLFDEAWKRHFETFNHFCNGNFQPDYWGTFNV